MSLMKKHSYIVWGTVVFLCSWSVNSRVAQAQASPPPTEESPQAAIVAEPAEPTAPEVPAVPAPEAPQVTPPPGPTPSPPAPPVAPPPQPVAPPTATPPPPPTPVIIQYADLRKQPKKLNIVEGQAPPPGYVEVERGRRGLIIAGSTVFGGVYLACVMLSPIDRNLLIPVIGPIIAGYSDDDEYYSGEEWEEDDRYAERLYGTLGSLAQVTGVALFIAGMASKKKIWLRQDIAGVKMQLHPTMIGRNEPGLGISGTF